MEENKELKLEDTVFNVLLKFDDSSRKPNTENFEKVLETCSDVEKQDIQSFVNALGYIPSLKELQTVLEKLVKVEKKKKKK